MKWLVIMSMLIAGSSLTVAQAGPVVRVIASEVEGSLQDTVKKIREDDEGIVILFVKAQGSYYLKRDVTDFDSLRKKLEVSLKNQKPVSVTFESEHLNIVDVK